MNIENKSPFLVFLVLLIVFMAGFVASEGLRYEPNIENKQYTYDYEGILTYSDLNTSIHIFRHIVGVGEFNFESILRTNIYYSTCVNENITRTSDGLEMVDCLEYANMSYTSSELNDQLDLMMDDDILRRIEVNDKRKDSRILVPVRSGGITGESQR